MWITIVWGDMVNKRDIQEIKRFVLSIYVVYNGLCIIISLYDLM
jgi:hypothetical protein